ncbi:hypothetical protein C4566_02740 [Candidatus Parcubacteria bacterium]|nr:MAG: hypothetical protein C4566_02740 [Candidatus Parcubacteria bacterium]
MLIKNSQGITTIEILIVMVIIAVVSSMSVVSYTNWKRQVKLINTQEEIKSTIVRAQQLATAASENEIWGVHFEIDKYVLFSGSFYDENNINNKVWTLQGVRIADPENSLADGAGGYGPDLFFYKFIGTTANTGTITIMPTGESNASKSIIVNASGQID